MRIALFASAFHPHVGGVEELCRQLALDYRRRGLGVVVLTNRWPRDLPAYEEVDGVPVHRLAMRVSTGHWRADLSHAVTAGGVRRQTVGILRRAGVDVIHLQCVTCTVPYAVAAQRALGVPLVVSLQGELSMDAAGVFRRPGIGQDLMRSALSEADAITACSGHTLVEAEAFFGRPFGDRGRVVYNGIRLADFDGVEPYRHPRPYVLAIGRHVVQKGFDVLLRAWAAAGDVGHDLILAGDGAEHDNLRALAASLGVADRVAFTGSADRPMAVSLFAGCSFFVLPSRHEPFGIVNLEAMAAGKAIVATAVGGVPEIVTDGVNGVLVPNEDSGAMSKAIIRLADSLAGRESLATQGRQRAEQFDWSIVGHRYLEIFEGLNDAKASIIPELADREAR